MDFERAREIFRVTLDGHLVWRISTGPRARVGARAGRLRPDGYRHVKTGGRQYLEHRVVWLIVHGAWPAGEVDHINSVRDDNRPENLRAAGRNENNQHAWKRPRSLPKGVCLDPTGRYRAQITARSEKHYLGLFDTPEDAKTAYDDAARRLHGEFAAL